VVAVAAGWTVSRRARLACPDREMSDAATDSRPLLTSTRRCVP